VWDEEKIRQIVRRVVYRTLGLDHKTTNAPNNTTQPHQAAVSTTTEHASNASQASHISTTSDNSAKQPQTTTMTKDDVKAYIDVVAIASDHGGYALKQELKTYLSELGYKIVDCGTDSTKAVDYPDFAYSAAQMVSQGQVKRAIIIDGAGIGSCIVANKLPNVRAAMCYDHATTINSREHNDANVLTLGAGLIGSNLARQIAKLWLETAHGGGRHAARVQKIIEIERRLLKNP
jgi:ribose 5-phosphate isomerase B